MAVITPSTTNTTSVAPSTNASSEYLTLGPGQNTVTVYSASWSGSKAAALMFSSILDDAAVGAVRKEINGTAVSFTANESVVLNGPGVVRIDVTSSNSSAVYMNVQACDLPL